jgi:anti-sigma factor RsiW
MKCDGYRILIREMLHGRLDVDEATVVAAHMDACESCRSFHRELAAGDPAGGEHIAEVASAPEKPPVARAGILPVAIAVILLLPARRRLMQARLVWRAAAARFQRAVRRSLNTVRNGR